MASYLGIDYGTKRIGIAAGDDVTRIASPVTTITAQGRTDRDVESIASIADEYGAVAFVLGLPLNMNGTEGPQAKLVRVFGAALAARTSVSRRTRPTTCCDRPISHERRRKACRTPWRPRSSYRRS